MHIGILDARAAGVTARTHRPTALLAVAVVLVALLAGPRPTAPSARAPSSGGPVPTPAAARHAEDRAASPPDRVLARPDSGPDAEDAFTVPATAIHTYDTTHVRLHWTSEGPDAATAAFVKQMARTFEEVWRAEVTDLGWPAPLPDAGLGGTAPDGADLVDVYVVDLAGEAFGYAAADADALCGSCGEVHGYLVMDNDYADYLPDPLGALQATAAHEFSHLVQFGMAYHAEGWAYEATAVWLERVVYPDVDARTQYLTDFAAAPELALSDFGTDTGGFDRAYGAYVWNVWLADRYGPELVRDAWSAAAAADDHVLGGYATALAQRGALLEQELVAFTAATAAWERGGFPAEPVGYPPIAREVLLESGTTTTVAVDHAAAYVADVRAGGTVTVTVRGPKFVAGGIGLVAGTGTEVVSALDDTLFDGEATVTLRGGAGATRITLVIVNADPGLAVPKPPGSDRPRYLFDQVDYLVGVDVDPGPRTKP